MNLAMATAAALLAAGVAVVWLASLGMWRLPTPLDRLHCIGLAGTWGSALIALAVIAAHPADQLGLKAALLAALTWCFGPVLSHAQASLAYRIETSDRRRSPDDQEE